MIIIDERQFVTQQLENKGFHVFDFYDGHQVLSVQSFCELPLQKRADILLVDTRSVLKRPEAEGALFPLLNTFLGVVFFHQHDDQESQQWVEQQSAFLTKIVGECSLPMSDLRWSILGNQLQSFWNILQDQKSLQRHLAQFSLELDQVLKTAESEMTKARKIHEVLIPKRNEEVRGIQFFHKYHVGDGGGGEFYDMFHLDNQAFQVMISSQSYLISSALMGLLNKEKASFHAGQFLELAREEIATINGAKKKKSEVTVSVLVTDLSQLTMELHGSDKLELYSQGRGRLDLSEGSHHQLSKGEKIIVLSPGFIFNWKESQTKQAPADFINSHQGQNSQELLMELFFQLRKSDNLDVSRKDATAVVMEVNRHGIHKV
jgi:hypothetical protein